MNLDLSLLDRKHSSVKPGSSCARNEQPNRPPSLRGTARRRIARHSALNAQER